MIHRRTLLAGLPMVAVASHLAHAVPRRLGWLVYGPPPLGGIDRSMHDALAERGLRDGETIVIAYRYAHGDFGRIQALARDLVATAPEVLTCNGGDLVRVLQDETTTIPIVAGVSDDPVRTGSAHSYARPDRNFTGVTYLTDEMAGKRLQLLRDAMPEAIRIAVIWNPQHLDDEMTNARAAAPGFGMQVTSFEVKDTEQVEAALAAIAAEGADGLFVIPSRFTFLHRGLILDFAQARRLPVVGAWREFTEGGGLLSYGPNRRAGSRVLAGQIARILDGARVGELPIERTTIFELVVNSRTAKRLGLTLPRSLLAAADQVIE